MLAPGVAPRICGIHRVVDITRQHLKLASTWPPAAAGKAELFGISSGNGIGQRHHRVRYFDRHRVDAPLASEFFVPDDDVPPPGVAVMRRRAYQCITVGSGSKPVIL
jgi:hypothetical protein